MHFLVALIIMLTLCGVTIVTFFRRIKGDVLSSILENCNVMDLDPHQENPELNSHNPKLNSHCTELF